MKIYQNGWVLDTENNFECFWLPAWNLLSNEEFKLFHLIKSFSSENTENYKLKTILLQNKLDNSR